MTNLWTFVFFLFLGITTTRAVNCGALSGKQPSCANHFLIVIDASSYLESSDQANQIFNFVSEHLMKAWGYEENVQFSFVLYGLKDRSNPSVYCAGYVTYGLADPEIICNALLNIQVVLNMGVLAPISLQEIAIDIYNCTIKGERKAYDMIILFTANNNQTDIINSTWLNEDHPVIVVNLGDGDFGFWLSVNPRSVILCGDQDLDDWLATQIIEATCGEITGVVKCGPSTRPTNIPSTTSPFNDNLCDCDISQSWNDVMILADSSSAMGINRFHELQAFVQSAFTQATIGPDQSRNTRIGTISYSNQAIKTASLNKYNTTKAFLNEDWEYLGGDDTNILAALDMAIDEFEENHRPASRQVIIIGASTYRNGPYDSPIQQSLTFKANFGVIIVIGYGDIHGAGTDILPQIASPGFYLNATPGSIPDFDVLTQMLCNANCFCPGEPSGNLEKYFQITNPDETWPALGCYWDSTLTSIQSLVNNTCQHLSSAVGIPTMPDTLAKQRGLISGAASNLIRPIFYVGLHRREGGVWRWDDGSLYTGDDLMGDGDCAVVQQGSGFNVILSAVDCAYGYYYSCQTQPCTTTRYCQ